MALFRAVLGVFELSFVGPTTDNASLLHDVQERIQSLKNDLMNISMEARLSIELEMRDNKAIVSSLSRNVDSLSSKYQELNDLYVKECARRRRVFSFYHSHLGVQRAARSSRFDTCILSHSSTDSSRDCSLGGGRCEVIVSNFSYPAKSTITLSKSASPNPALIPVRDSVVRRRSTSTTASSVRRPRRAKCFPRCRVW